MPKKMYNDNELRRRSGAPGVRDDEVGRSAFKKDYSRLLHAPSFRRLQGKTQLFPGDASDFFRNRLTHSLEVAQIACGIADKLNADDPGLAIDRELVQFAAIAHDLGHPPFGHNGEHVLDHLMRDHGGFEGNAQTLHILACIERKLVTVEADLRSDFGLDLTYRTLASILKYDKEIPLKRHGNLFVKGYYAEESELVADIKEQVAPGHKGDFKTIECAIMDIADDIAYSTYDLEDSLHAGFVSPFSLLDALLYNPVIFDKVTRATNEILLAAQYDPLEENELLEFACWRLDVTKDAMGPEDTTGSELIDQARNKVKAFKVNRHFSNDTLTRTQFTAERVGKLIQQVSCEKNNDFPALSKIKLSRLALVDIELFKHLNRELVIASPKLKVAQHRGKEIVEKVFSAILDSKGSLLPNHWRETYEHAEDENRKRVICDFVANMTDHYAVEFYDNLYGEGKSLYGPA